MTVHATGATGMTVTKPPRTIYLFQQLGPNPCVNNHDTTYVYIGS